MDWAACFSRLGVSVWGFIPTPFVANIHTESPWQRRIALLPGALFSVLCSLFSALRADRSRWLIANHLVQLPGSHIVDRAADRDVVGDQRRVADCRDIVADALRQIREG